MVLIGFLTTLVCITYHYHSSTLASPIPISNPNENLVSLGDKDSQGTATGTHYHHHHGVVKRESAVANMHTNPNYVNEMKKDAEEEKKGLIFIINYTLLVFDFYFLTIVF